MSAMSEYLNDWWMSEIPLDSDFDDPNLDEE